MFLPIACVGLKNPKHKPAKTAVGIHEKKPVEKKIPAAKKEPAAKDVPSNESKLPIKKETKIPGPSIFKEMEIRSNFIRRDKNNIAQTIGLITKKSGETSIKISTIRRVCGSGRGSKSVRFFSDQAIFSLRYRWCRIDPGDLASIRCIQCEYKTYDCTLTLPSVTPEKKESSIHNSYRKPIPCEIKRMKICERNCPPLK